MFRITHNNFERTFDLTQFDTEDINEWQNSTRLAEAGWGDRYQYESDVIINAIGDNKINSILEIGSGPGLLSQMIQIKLKYDVQYDLIDKPYAKTYFNDNIFKGNFYVKDISIDLDISDLANEYDLIICNDVLEHLLAPINIVRKMRQLMHKDSILFISVPNWRMAHQFFYRGLWDYDNFLYMMHVCRLYCEQVYGSPLQTPYYAKLDSESTMPDELLTSWNFYFKLKKHE